MAEEKLDLEKEVIQIFEHIDKGENFLLSGGAGSGKTYSLVQVIKEVIVRNPTSKVACMTFTNAAVKEIERRVDHKNLSVTTIHDFLWDCIKSFQGELKKSIISLINDDAVTEISIATGPANPDYFDQVENGIQYKEWLSLKDGIISHDELIILANYMFANYPKLCDILRDKYKFVFIDEYQDTHDKVVELFLVHLRASKKNNIIGFFGDAMQAIYEDGVGNLDVYKNQTPCLVYEVKKEQNRRNPETVIHLANRLRTDGLTQVGSNDQKAPNMIDGQLKKGTIKFLYSSNGDFDAIKGSAHFNGWDFNNSKETKELNLTHNLIAPKAGYINLMAIYDRDPIIGLKDDIVKRIKERGIIIDENATFDEIAIQVPLPNRQRIPRRDLIIQDPNKNALYIQLKDLPFSVVRKIYLNKDSLIDDKKQDEEDENKKGSKRDNLIKHLFKIQTLVHFYKEKQYNEFIRKTEIQVKSIKDKVTIKDIIEHIERMFDNSIEEVINFADEKGICKRDDRLQKFVTENEYLYNRVKTVKYGEFQKLFYFLEGFTPFSTQHKIKGAEFNNVLVILDNGGWHSRYNFEQLFLGGGSSSVLSNTQKIFYVCCTRAKENLVVYFHSPNSQVISKAVNWFGSENVHQI